MKHPIHTLLIALIPLLLLGGCSSKQLYTFGDTANITPNGRENHLFIAVEKVELPIYFMDSPIYRKSTPYHLEKMDNANWIHSMDEHLTNVLITYLQKSLNNPNIYAYPWSDINKMDKKISLHITQLIAYQQIVHLEANYQILDKQTRKLSNHLFSTHTPMQDASIESMLHAMEKSYFTLVEEIKSKL